MKYKNLREYKKDKKYTSKSLAGILGISKDYVDKICYGAIPSLKVARRISKITGISLVDLIGLSKDEIK